MNPESVNEISSQQRDAASHEETAFHTEVHPAMRIVVLLGLVLLGTAIFSILGIVLAVFLYHLNIIANPNVLSDTSVPGVIPALKIIQTASALGIFVLPALVFARMSAKRPLAFLGLDKIPKPAWIALAVFTMLFAGPLINLMGELNSRMNFPESLAGVQHWMLDKENEAAKLTTEFLKADGPSGLVVNLLIVALLAALGEELFFRGVLQKLLSRWMNSRHLAIWVTAIVFSAIHMQFFGFLPRLAIGALLGYLYVWSGSLWVPILAHFTNNAFAVIVTYLIQHKTISSQAETVGNSKEDLVYILVSLFLTTALIFVSWKFRKKQEF